MNINISEKLLNLTSKSGVYQMLNRENKIIYIGKAKNLKKRVSSYFNAGRQNAKTIAMVNKIIDFEVIVVETEIKALLLENELIKQHRPKYNILLKDSKTYPYIFISNEKHPKIGFYRGIKDKKNKYFGPYPSVGIIRDSLDLLKKIFKLRSCSNVVYKMRSRPCLEYQIGLCSAPCVDKISVENYNKDCENAKNFLLGKSRDILNSVEEKMQYYANKQEFELAAHYRDQMASLRKLQEQHTSNTHFDIDFIYICKDFEVFCVQILFIRDGKQVDNDTIFPKNINDLDEGEALSAFIPLYYFDKITPKTLATNTYVNDTENIEKLLNCKIITRLNEDKKHFMNIAKLTAIENLKYFLIKKNRQSKQLLALKATLNLQKIPNHIECFDISHNSGEATIASCVVFKNGSPSKIDYRLFNINDVIAGDDYGAMRQAIFRRYKKAENIPDLLLVDGGLGQLNQAIMVFDSIGIDGCLIVGVAKGEGRRAGLETLIVKSDEIVNKINLKPDDIALNLINFVRDEAHRFAITNHRKKFKKTRNVSILESIEGVGINKRKKLLNYFGSVNEVKSAGLSELIKVDGINNKIATNIIDFFQNN